jgi:hypothetical protein
MQRRTKHEYRFEIDAFSPETIPLARLSQYLGDIARMMGENTSVHLVRIDSGSTVPIIGVDWEAEPKVRERLRAVKFGEGPAEARRAYKEINKKLVQDNANGRLIDPGDSSVIRFPGRDAANQVEFGPINQPGSFQGVPIKIGGENDPVPVHLEEGTETHIVMAPRRIAKQLASCLFTSVVRVEGKGRWIRNRLGEWELLSFHATGFEVLRDGDIRTQVAVLQAIPAKWKNREDPLRDLSSLRHGEGI